MAPTAIAAVPCTFAVVPSARFQYKLLPIKVPLTRGKLLVPFKREVTGLIK